MAVAAIARHLSSPAIAGADRIRNEGPLISYSSAIPSDASGKTQVTLHVWGLQPNTEYGAHAHVNACGPTGSAAGPHFQYTPDPVLPSVNPAYANPRNEIWLDLTTDESGNGVAQTRVPWQFTPDRRAHSVIIHVEHTHTGPTDSGVAGARLACLSVDF